MTFNLKFAIPARPQLLRLIADCLVLIVLLTVAANFRHFWFTTTQRGFFCDDESLMYPYMDSTVSGTLLYTLGFSLPLAAIVIMELSKCCRHWTGGQWHLFWPLYNSVRYFLFGYAAQSLLKNIGKHTVGRLRPHFFALCRPLLADGGRCTDEAHRAGGVYHVNYSCRSDGSSSRTLRDAHISFPSGHSSLAFYGLIFLALHLQRRGRCPVALVGTLLRPFCQLFCVALATFVAVSRIMDYKHHATDVAAGSLLGAGVALVVICLAELEAKVQQPQQTAQQQQQQSSGDSVSSVKAEAATATELQTQTLPQPLPQPLPPTQSQLAHDLFVVTSVN